MPTCYAILNHPTIENLMAYRLLNHFKDQRGFIIYDFETLSDQVMKNITDQTSLLSQLSKLSIASTEVYLNNDKPVKFGINAKSYELVKRHYTLFDKLANDYQEQLEIYGLPSNSSFVHLWLAQTFVSAEQIYQSMKYDNENIPFDKCVKVLGWNSSRFDIALQCDALDCELWSMSIPNGDLNNTKSITTCVKDDMNHVDSNGFRGDKSSQEDNGILPYEIVNTKNWKEIIMKTEPFEYEDYKLQLK
ncbi:MAG: hypothetical protein EZS28_005084 [Streblomastix strix]|uniref:Uncharacterized protein n=1 Tax=Streblomastix strix TaxID=222440 RepID=A0A5J4WWH0_9EUKA|nr:MAG: hypothetical protein EZS28_005084 [Streblomastix strix]